MEVTMKKILIAPLIATLSMISSPGTADTDKSIFDTEWKSYIQPLEPIGAEMSKYVRHQDDPQTRQEYYRNLLQVIALGYFTQVYVDTDHPDFIPWFNTAFTTLAPNPDNNYYLVPLDDQGVYKISGYRGTVYKLLAQIGAGTFITKGIQDERKLGHTLSNHSFDDLAQDENGYFEVIVSPQRPEGYTGDWWQLKPEASNLFVRQISYDWSNELDARLAIERLDTPAAKPRPDPEQLAQAMADVTTWTAGTFEATADFVAEMTQGIEENQIQFVDLTNYAGIFTQGYAYGVFNLADDEALIIDAKMPAQACDYYSIHLLDDYAYTMDAMNRRTSINGHMAVIDDDNHFRAVISNTDPGVPNWLDASGYKTGFIQARWENCQDAMPQYSTQKVKLAELRDHLPPSTSEVTPQAREADIRQRRKAIQMRKRW
jgi:hypothetical protein